MPDPRINDEAQAVAREGVWVQATRDFGYDVKIGEVKNGQVFQLGGHVNDAGLVRHMMVAVLDPQPTKAALKKMPTCGECGRVFALDWMRDRCGRSHEVSDEQKLEDRRVRVHDRVLDDIGDRVFTVGA